MWFLLIFDDVADTFSAAFLKQGNSTAPLKTNIPWLKMPCKNVNALEQKHSQRSEYLGPLLLKITAD